MLAKERLRHVATLNKVRQHEDRKKVICFFNSIVNNTGLDIQFVGFSGGDVRFVEVFKRINNMDKIIVTSQIGKDLCDLNKVEANFILTTKELHTRNILLTDFLRTTKALFLKIAQKSNDVIYSASDFLMDILPAFVLKLRSRKSKWVICIFLIMPTLFKDYTRSFSKNNGFSLPTLRRILYFTSQKLTISLGKRWADQILVLNNMDKKYLEKSGVDPSKIRVVTGGVDYEHIKDMKNKTKLFDGIFLGRFHPQKGIFDLVKIWKAVCSKRPNAQLCIIGTGSAPLVEEVMETIKEHKLSDNITLVGSKSGEEKFSLLKSSNVFLCPSYYESFAIVIAEAMACGLPVVAYNLPIYGDIYEKRILKVPLGNLDQFADAVLHFLDNDESRKAYGLEGQKFVSRYDWADIAQKEYKLMTDLPDSF